MKDIRLNRDNFTQPLLTWYRASRRRLPWRKTRDPYKIWVSEIMLQQTRVETVIPYFEDWMAAYPTVEDLAKSDLEEVLMHWEGLGYYRRARFLHQGAREVVALGHMPKTFDQWRKIKGVGDYTAGAITSIAYGERVPAVDGNVLRVMARVLAYRDDVLTGRAKSYIREELIPLLPEVEDMGDFTQALIELGALVCLAKGIIACDSCPIQEVCLAKAQGIQADLPVRKSKTKVVDEDKTVFLLRVGDRWAIRQREESLLHGLWEFPMASGHREQEVWEEHLAGLGLGYKSIERLEDAKAVFSHRRWHMEGYMLELSEEVEGYTWVKREDLDRAYPMASAVRVYERDLKEREEE